MRVVIEAKGNDEFIRTLVDFLSAIEKHAEDYDSEIIVKEERKNERGEML